MTTAEEKVAEILKRLPVLEDKRPAIAGWARRLALISDLSAFTELPRARQAREKTAKAEVDKLAALAIQFANHVDRMHRNSLAVFEGGDCRSPLRLADQLWKLAQVAGQNQPAPGGKSGPRKTKAARTATQALIAYETLTGKKATVRVKSMGGEAYGPYRRTTSCLEPM